MPRKLRNIRLSEVSLVDKAANKRKFAFIKADTSTSSDIATTDITRVIKALLGEDPPDDFNAHIELLDDGSKAGLSALLSVADEYQDALPEAIAKSFAQMTMAAVEPDEATDLLDAETVMKASSLRKTGNRLIKELERLVDQSRTNGGSTRYFAQPLVQLDEFTSSLRWLVATTDEERQTSSDMPELPEKTGLGTAYPIGKAAKHVMKVKHLGKTHEAVVKFRCPKCHKAEMKVTSSKRAGDKTLVAKCPICGHVATIKRSALKKKLIAAFKASTTCPKCKKSFKPMVAKDGKVTCPHCGAVGKLKS